MDAYQALKVALAAGVRGSEACMSIRRSHGLTHEQVCDLYYRVTTGAPCPEWAKSGTEEAIHDPTGERRRWESESEL